MKVTTLKARNESYDLKTHMKKHKGEAWLPIDGLACDIRQSKVVVDGGGDAATQEEMDGIRGQGTSSAGSGS